MPSGFIINGSDLDSLFKSRVTAKRLDIGYQNSSGVDLSNLYEKSTTVYDQLGFNTGFAISDGTDLRYLFQRADYNPFNDTLQFNVEQYLGDCWRLKVSSPTGRNLTYRVFYRVSSDVTGDFISTTSTTLIANPINTGRTTLYFYKIQLLNNAKTQVLATWDVEKTFYTGSDINSNTVRAFTIANTADQGSANADYYLNSNIFGSGQATAVFTLGLFHPTQLI